MSVEIRAPEADQPWGHFPFGQPNSRRPMRLPTSSPVQALVVGVYPSALHMGWSPPTSVDPRKPKDRRRRFIGSLAVDVEPVVFWDGLAPTPTTELARWAETVGFAAARHGQIWSGTNGPSGATLVKQYLKPLGLDADRVAFTDVVPWFFVYGSQRAAIAERFAPIAGDLAVHPGSLPPRPNDAQLVRIAGSEPRRTTLRREIIEAGAPVVITLGNSALGAVRAVADSMDGAPNSLSPETYGAIGHLFIDEHGFELLPMVHPGFLSKLGNRPAWQKALDRWHPRLNTERQQ